MKIVIVGIGYVGLVIGICFFEMGVDVICVDVIEFKIDNFKKGIILIYELGFEDMVYCNYNVGCLKFIIFLVLCLNDVEVVFSVVGIFFDEDGSVDLKYVFEVVCMIGKMMNYYVLVVMKSIVFVGIV